MRCKIAETETGAEYFCTRPSGHDGPCAAWTFAELVQERIESKGITDAEIAQRFDMSRSSAARWRAGRNHPHPAMRAHVIDWLEEYANIST